MKPRELLLNICLAAGTLVVMFLLAEGALRVVQSAALNPFEPDPRLGYRLKADFDGAYPRTAVRTDPFGRRIPLDADWVPTGRLLFIGDSVTFGFGVLAEEAFPHLVGERLGRLPDVANAAVPGYNLEQALGLLEENAARQRPDLVVYGLCLNDVGSAHVHVDYGDIDPHRARSDEGGLLARSMLITFVQRRWQRIEDRFLPDEAGADRGGDVAVGEQRDEGAGVAGGGGAGGEAGGEAGDRSRGGFLARLLVDERFKSALRAFEAQWGRLQAWAAESGVPTVVVVLPFRQQIEDHPEWRAPQELVVRLCAEGPLRCLDPWEELRPRRDEGLYNGDSSMHFTPLGHQLVADWLTRRVRDLASSAEWREGEFPQDVSPPSP